MLTTFITPIATYVSFGSIKTRIKDWCFALLLLEAAMIGAFVALDLFLFYVFWELMLVPMYVIIGVWGGAEPHQGRAQVLPLHDGRQHADARRDPVPGRTRTSSSTRAATLRLLRAAAPGAPATRADLAASSAFALAFVIKVPMFPVHTWLPDAHTQAPTGGSVILAAVMLKLGTYGYLRFCMGLFPEAVARARRRPSRGVAVLGGILYGALCAWRQDDVKRLVAYSSVAPPRAS